MEPDEDLYSTGGRKTVANSKLASIFAQEPDYSTGTASLGYKGARAPVKGGTVPSMQQQTPSAASPSQSSQSQQALYACVITLIKYDAARNGTVVGSRALALMKHPSGGAVLVCYDAADPTKRDLMLPVTDTFAFMPQAPAYGFFYDDAKNYWCVQLATADALQDLARAIGLAKGAASHTAGGVSVVTQDLFINAAEPRAISNGDAVKIRFNLYAFNGTPQLGAVLSVVGTEEKPKQVKLGAGKDIVGLEQGLVGMKKGGKRLLIVPSSLGYGVAGNSALNVTPNSWVALEIELLKVKHADKPQAALMPGTPVASQPASQVSPVKPPVIILGGGSDDSAAAASAESGEKPDSRRNSLVHRMAAMGGFAMPNMNPLQAQHALHHSHPPTTPASVGTPAAAPAGETNDEPHQQTQQHQSQGVVSPPPPSQPTLSHNNSQANYQPGQQEQHHQHQQHLAPHQQQHTQQHHQPHHHQQNHSQQFQQSPPSQGFGHPGQQQGYNPYYPNPAQPQQPHMHGYPGSVVAPGSYPPTGAPGPYGVNPSAQQQFGVAPGGPGGMIHPPTGIVPPHIFQSLDTKLDTIQSALNKCLGSANQYDPNGGVLTGTQMIRGLNALLTEREELKTKADKGEEKILELQSKLSALHERNENYLAENSKMSEARFASFSEEMKAKNAQLSELQDALRNVQHDLTSSKSSAVETELKFQKIQLELELAKGEVQGKKDLEKSNVLLQIQLDELNNKHTKVGEEIKSSLAMDLAKMKQEVEEANNKIEEMNARQEKELKEKDEAHARLQAKFNTLETEVATLEKSKASAQSELESLKSQLKDRDLSLEQLKLQLEHSRQEGSSEKDEIHQQFQSEREEFQKRIEGLQTELERVREERSAFESSMLARIAETKQQHDQALVDAHNAGLEEGASNTGGEWKNKLSDVMSKAKGKIEHLQAELDQALQEKVDLEATVAQLTEEKQNVLDQSKSVIAKIRSQVQEQQARHQEELTQAREAAASAAANAAASAASSASALPSDGVDWREKVRLQSKTLFQTLAASLAQSEEESFTRLQIRDILVKDIKQVTVQILSGDEEAPAARAEAETSASEPETDSASGAASAVAEEAVSVAAPEAVAEPEQQPEPEPEPAAVQEPEAVSKDVAAAAEPVAEKAAEPVSDEKAAEPAATPAVATDDHDDEPASSASASSGGAKSKNAKKKAKKKAAAARKGSHADEEKHEETAPKTPIVEAQPAPEEPTPIVEPEPESQPEPVPAVVEPVVTEPVVEPAVEDEPVIVEAAEAAASPIASTEAKEETKPAESESSSVVPGGAPVVEPTEEVGEIPSRSRSVATGGSVSAVTIPAAASAPKPTLKVPFDDSDDVPAASSKAAPPATSAAAKPKSASSLFGDDDDDDLFPPPAAASSKLKAEPKKASLFDDDDDGF